jgi:hypothetical protein
MENNMEKPESQQCGPDCACKAEKGLSRRTKIILLAVIIVCAGAVLTSAIVRKSQKPQVQTCSSYASALSLKSEAPTKTDSTSAATDTGKSISFAMLPSLASLDTLAVNYDGVFILMVKSEVEKTKAITQEIGNAAATITAKGMSMGAFQLATGTPEFESFSTQVPPPGVIVVVKGRGMRVVAGKDITRTNLLQACIAAMQPSSCCPAGGNQVCKKKI